MKKNGKRLLAMLMALVTVFGICVIPGAAAKEAPYTYENYVSLGDSVPYGCFLPFFNNMEEVKKRTYTDDNDGAFIVGAYPQLLTDEMVPDPKNSGRYLNDIQINNAFAGARCGLRVHDVLVLLGKAQPDDFTRDMMINNPGWGGMQLQPDFFTENQPKYQQAIRDADLITIELGSNDIFGTYVYYTGSKGYSKIRATPVLVAASEKFKRDWDILMKTIYDMNPDVDVIVLGIYSGSDESAQVLFDSMNSYMQYGSAYCNRYTYMDTAWLGKYVRGGGTSDGGNHPDLAGHEKIAQKIVEAIVEHGGHTCSPEAGHNLNLGLLSYKGGCICPVCHKSIPAQLIVNKTGNDLLFDARNAVSQVKGAVTRATNAVSDFFTGLFKK